MKENDETNIWIKKVRAITKLKISVEFFYTGKNNQKVWSIFYNIVTSLLNILLF